MWDFDNVVIFITVGTDEEARKIAEALLERRKAACVNILPQVHSLFWWQGRIDSTDEALLLVKTELRLLGAIVKLVRKLHSYDVPEIIALPLIGGSERYLAWISESLKKKTKKGITKKEKIRRIKRDLRKASINGEWRRRKVDRSSRRRNSQGKINR